MSVSNARPWVALLAVVLVMTALGSAGPPAFAQSAFTISGTARDSTGAVVPGATVTATNAATRAERSVVTDAEGRYQLTGLPAGRYEIRVALTGFRTELRTVEVKADTVADFSLGVELQEQIVVTALRRAERLQDKIHGGAGGWRPSRRCPCGG